MAATMGTRTERLAGEVASSCESPLGSAWRDLLGFGHQPGKAMRVGGLIFTGPASMRLVSYLHQGSACRFLALALLALHKG